MGKSPELSANEQPTVRQHHVRQHQVTMAVMQQLRLNDIANIPMSTTTTSISI